MKALVVGASEESIHAISVVRSMGYEVVALDGSANAQGLTFADDHHIVDITNPDAVLSLFDEPPAFIIPVPVGRVLVSTGKLNDYWGLPGVGSKAALLCTDKYEFFKALASEGLRSGRCVLEEEIVSNPQIIKSFRFPVVAKPRFGSGSRGVYLASCASELGAFLSQQDSTEYIVEEAFEGDEYGLDGLVHNGKLSVLLLRKKVNTLPPACQCIGYQTLTALPELYCSIQDYVQRAVGVVGLNEALIHVDLMIRDEEIFIIEMSARPSGHGIHDQLLPLAIGLDPIETFVSVCVRKEKMPLIKRRRSLYMGFFAFDDCVVERIPPRTEIESVYAPLVYEINFKEGDYLGPIQDGSVTQRGRFILAGHPDTLVQKARSFIESFKVTR